MTLDGGKGAWSDTAAAASQQCGPGEMGGAPDIELLAQLLPNLVGLGAEGVPHGALLQRHDRQVARRPLPDGHLPLELRDVRRVRVLQANVLETVYAGQQAIGNHHTQDDAQSKVKGEFGKVDVLE